MKRYLYYITPFIVIGVATLLCEHFDNIESINMPSYTYLVVLLLICIFIGNISPTNKKFDYVITLITPLTFFCIMFVSGFLKSGCSGEPSFSLVDAFEAAFQPLSLIAYCGMALITFLSSFKPIRITNKLNRNKKC